MKILLPFKLIGPKRVKPRARGFTLVEVILYISLFSVLLIVLTEIIAATFDVQLESEARTESEGEAKFIMTRLLYDINRASSIAVPASLGQTATSLQLVIGGTNYTYNLSSQNLQLTTSLGTDNLNSSQVQIQAVSFQRVGNVGGKPTVRINLTLASSTQVSGNSEVRSYQTTVGLR